VTEHPGFGLEASIGGTVYRLGKPEWALTDVGDRRSALQTANVALSQEGRCLAAFHFEDRPRSGAREAVASLTGAGLAVEILSGDHEARVRQLASVLALPHASAVTPKEKAARIAACGQKVLMVGDGLNDAPALVAAHASMVPASAADVGRNAADLVFLRESLLAVPQAIAVARQAARLVRQNLVMAVGYNVIAVPIAIMGYATPLVAAVAMSLSSVVVVGNALRLGKVRPSGGKENGPQAELASPHLVLVGGK
jgi:Cu2+-exporting ATPase